MDLTPRTEAPAPPAGGPARRRRWLPLLVLAAVLVAGGVIVTQFLRSAVDYFCNVDEIGHRAGCEADRRLRVQGTVDAGTVETLGGVTTFTISFKGVTMPVRYEGEPGGMFRECQPVVVHGRYHDGRFDGDQVEVKHSNEYVEDNAERLDPAQAASESATCTPGG